MIMATTTIQSQQATGSSLLIRYVEIWQPTADGQSLELQQARWTDGQVAHAERSIRCAGEGAVGSAWQTHRAVVIKENSSSEIAASLDPEAGDLVAAIAIPVVRQTTSLGVIMLGLGAGYGAVELWHRDDRDELSVDQSWYAGLPSFQFMNRYVRFPKGGGVPGHIWKTGEPQLIADPGNSESFVRTFENDPANLTAAAGLPVGSAAGFAESVLLLLSSRQFPLARSMELWSCEAEAHADSEHVNGLHITEISVVSESGEECSDSSESAWRQQVADHVVRLNMLQLLDATDTTLPAGVQIVLTFPVYRGSDVVALFALTF